MDDLRVFRGVTWMRRVQDRRKWNKDEEAFLQQWSEMGWMDRITQVKKSALPVTHFAMPNCIEVNSNGYRKYGCEPMVPGKDIRQLRESILE